MSYKTRYSRTIGALNPCGSLYIKIHQQSRLYEPIYIGNEDTLKGVMGNLIWSLLCLHPRR